MPLVQSTYKRPPFYYLNGHVETILPSLFRTVDGVEYQREVIETPDDDFLEVDWVKNKSKKLVVISHGLEGNSERHYVKGVAKLFGKAGWDVVAWNNRTCGSKMNRQRIMYHHAASYDLRTVVDYAVAQNQYEYISLVGISMGGGQTLRYLGERETHPLPVQVQSAVAISVPVSLIESAATLQWKSNRMYEKKFLERLKLKIKAKAKQFPDIDVSGIDSMKKLTDFDERYTAPIHGFEDAKAFYEFCNPFPFMKKINVPTLIINALNDPLLVGDCYPKNFAEQSDVIYLEMPKRGGHVGFIQAGEFTYAEERAFEFIADQAAAVI